MNRNILSASLLMIITLDVTAQCEENRAGVEQVIGYVYLDENKDLVKDEGDRGLPDISVSNGCSVVQTDQNGRYEITLAPFEILFISKPANFSLPLDENNVPKFFYRHYPEGTPAQVANTSVEWLWPVTAPTGTLPESLNFPVFEAEEASSKFTAHGFADTQAQSEIDQDMLREDLINPLINNPYSVEFGLTVGDVVFDKLDLYDRHKAMMGLIGIPQWYLPGNHDINFESPDANFANETYKMHFGPTYYSFNYGNVHFVALNNVEYAGDGNQFDCDHLSYCRGVYRGYISPTQLQWLRNDLSQVGEERLIVIATHIPLLTEADDGVSERITGPYTENFSELWDILEPFEHIYGLAGHDTSHSWKVEINHEHGWSGKPWIAHTLAEVRGSGWRRGPQDLRQVRDAMMQDGNPNGFYVLRFDDTKLTPEFIPFPFGPDSAGRLRITLEPSLTSPETGSVNRGYLEGPTKIIVNLFDGGARDSVWASIDGSRKELMTYTIRTDPFAEAQYEKFLDSDDAYPAPVRSAHIWEHPLPTALDDGLHSIVITSEDEFGQTQQGTFTFEILEN